MPASVLVPSRHRWIVLALCLALIATMQVTGRATASTAVVGGESAAYLPGSPGNPSTPVAYEGEPLTVQASYVGRQAAEPTVAVDPDGNAYVAAGTFDGPGIVVPQTYVMKSTDGGNTWEKTSPTLPNGNASPPVTLDPYIYSDPETGRLFNPELYVGCTYMNISDDGGDSWIPNPVACGSFVNDHQTIAVGNPPPALEPLMQAYPNVLYYCFNRIVDSNCGRSLDGGLTFQPTATPAFVGYDPAAGGLCGGLHGHIHVGPEGNLYLPKGHCNKPWLAISSDGGTSWTRTQVSDTVDAAGTHLAVETDDAGNVYFVWWDRENRLPYMAVSRDQGQTFGAPMMIAPPGVTEVNFPIVTAGEEGRVAIAFPGNSGEREDRLRPWHHYMVVTENALDEQPLFLSTTANPVSDPILRGNCGPGRCGPLWDFQDIQVSPAGGEFWAGVADGCVKACVTQGTSYRETVGEGMAVRQLTGPLLRPSLASPQG
jgi:hypothetical protein